jgi:hypothetical protein
MYFDIYI